MKNSIVDSHCHLDFDVFENDLDEVVNRARLNKIMFLLTISTNLEKFKYINELAKRYQNIWCTTGVHPNNVPDEITFNTNDDLIENLISNCNEKKVIGIGETGLDFYRKSNNKKNQIQFFESHAIVANETELPLIIHTRDAEDETINFFKNNINNKNKVCGLVHCFSSTQRLARIALDNQFYISFSGIVTFQNVDSLLEIVKYVPLDRILVETDSPYLSPAPNRGKRNEPANVKFTLQRIAELKNISHDKLAEITTKNFFKLFRKAKYEY
tara:strand:+ start:231 stop:1040 length:810 start_codon:yes stop_codon:yes gene_type:complete